MGTAVSYLLASNKHNVLIWARRKKICNQINKKRENPLYMPGLVFSESISATSDLEDCVTTSNKIVIAIPSHGVYDLCTKLGRHSSSKISWLTVVKGLDATTKCRTTELLENRLNVKKSQIATLSGPNFAIEIVKKVPTFAVIGSKSSKTASLFQESLLNEYFQIETTSDLNGVEIGGIMKNIGAIAIGIVDGLNLGDNTRGLVFSLCLKECLEVGTKVFDAKADTLLGPACLGDMVTTAFSHKSRNRVLGLLASKGVTKIPESTYIAEGKNNAKIVKNFAGEHGIKVPITGFVCSVLEGKNPITAFNVLWRLIREIPRKKELPVG